MLIHVIIATTGRAEIAAAAVERLASQTRLADGIVVIGAHPADVADVADRNPAADVLIAPRGSCSQRNAGLDHIAGRSDVAVFFDDDLVADHDYLARVEQLFGADPELVGLTGHLVADGAHTGAIRWDDAVARLDRMGERIDAPSTETTWLYGCNMAVRLSAAVDLRFDTALPFYGWQEDVDFSARLGRQGRMMRVPQLTGIHLGVRGGRTSGRRFGYSQVANVFYLRRKGTIRLIHGWRLMLGNIAANLVRSIRPEPEIDRRGRLRGNILALADILRGRVDPRRIETFP